MNYKPIPQIVEELKLRPLDSRAFNMLRAHRVADSCYPIFTVIGYEPDDTPIACIYSASHNSHLLYRLKWNEPRKDYDAIDYK